jgi:hypothetical protein
MDNFHPRDRRGVKSKSFRLAMSGKETTASTKKSDKKKNKKA